MMKIDEENGRLTRSRHSTLKTMAMGHLVTSNTAGQLAMN